MFALDPPLGRGRRGDDRRPRRHRRLRPAAPPLRRRARPRARHHARAVGRHDREGRQQGDQERRGLRPRQAVHRLLRDARADRRRDRPPASQAGRDRHRGRRERRPRRARAGRGRRSPRCRSRPTRSTPPGSEGSGRLLARFGGASAGDQAEVDGRADARGGPRRRPDDRGRRGAVGRAARRPARGATTARRSRSPAASPTSPPRSARPRRPAARSSRAPRTGCRGSRSTPATSRAAPTDVRDALEPRPVVLLDGPAGLRARLRPLGPGRRRRAGGHAPAQGALRHRAHLPSRRLSWEASDGPGRGRLGRAPPARPRADQGLRALRLLPADVPELPDLRGGDGLAARPHRADAGRPRGRHELSDEMVTHFDRCLGCMACVTACPSGVQYDKLIEQTRPQIERHADRPLRAARLAARDLRALHPPGPAARARAGARAAAAHRAQRRARQAADPEAAVAARARPRRAGERRRSASSRR